MRPTFRVSNKNRSENKIVLNTQKYGVLFVAELGIEAEYKILTVCFIICRPKLALVPYMWKFQKFNQLLLMFKLHWWKICLDKKMRIL